MSMTTEGLKKPGVVDNTSKLPDKTVVNASGSTPVIVVKPSGAGFGKGAKSNGADDYRPDGTPKY